MKEMLIDQYNNPGQALETWKGKTKGEREETFDVKLG